ncbi:MAG: EFR1 family ferrodoxin [Thermodesulfobacteriota bacterium]
MDTLLYCYTGTGNSLWIARLLAERLGGASIVPIAPAADRGVAGPGAAAGIVFPVHIWGVPRRVIGFVDALKWDPAPYTFAVAVNAGQVAATLLQLEKRMHKRGLTLSAGFGIVMPTNYIPWGGPGPKEKQILRFKKAEARIATIAATVAAREQRPVERGPLWQNILFTWLNRLAYPHVPSMDKSFWVDENCNGCAICTTVCPCGNIRMRDGRPLWLHRCEQCLACIQWCPSEAIQFGKKTPRYDRYHHPEVTLSDVTTLRGGKEGTGK